MDGRVEMLDLDEEPAASPKAGRTAVGRGSQVRRAIAAVLSPEALGVASLSVALLLVLGGGQMMQWTFMASSAGDFVRAQATTNAWGGALALGLAITGLLRLPEHPTTLGRAAAGGGAVLAVLLLAITAYTITWVDQIPPGF